MICPSLYLVPFSLSAFWAFFAWSQGATCWRWIQYEWKCSADVHSNKQLVCKDKKSWLRQQIQISQEKKSRARAFVLVHWDWEAGHQSIQVLLLGLQRSKTHWICSSSVRSKVNCSICRSQKSSAMLSTCSTVSFFITVCIVDGTKSAVVSLSLRLHPWFVMRNEYLTLNGRICMNTKNLSHVPHIGMEILLGLNSELFPRCQVLGNLELQTANL